MYACVGCPRSEIKYILMVFTYNPVDVFVQFVVIVLVILFTQRSLKVIDVDTPRKVVSSTCYDKVSLCNRSHARRANSGKITIY